MIKQRLIMALCLLWPIAALAQAPVELFLPNNSYNPNQGTLITPTNPLPVTPLSGGTPQDTNIVKYGGTSTTLGQKASAASIPVTLPSDPDSRPASGNITIVDTTSSSTPGFNSVNVITGTPTVGSVKDYAINGQSSTVCTISGTWTGTLAFETSGNSASYIANTLRQRGSSLTASSVTANGIFEGDVSSMTNFRVRATAAMTGTAVAQCAFAATSGPVQIQNPIPPKTFQSSGAQQNALTVSTNTQLTVPTGTTCASLSVETAGVRRTSDATSASASNGTPIPAGRTWWDCGPLSAYKFTAQSGSPTITAEYFK